MMNTDKSSVTVKRSFEAKVAKMENDVYRPIAIINGKCLSAYFSPTFHFAPSTSSMKPTKRVTKIVTTNAQLDIQMYVNILVF